MRFSILGKIGVKMTANYTDDELEKWWIATCPRCGWEGLSKDCKGGEQIADTGDYDDCYCPECWKKDIWVIVDDN